MAYNIYKSDGSQLVTLDDYIIDNSTLSINLIGKNVSGYGAQQNENFLYLLENFSKETPPANPVTGQLWYDKASNVMRPMVYDGGTWRPLSVTLVSNTSTDSSLVSGAIISSQATGDFWYNTDKEQLFINTGTGYSLVGPEAVPGFGQTKLSSEELLDNSLQPHPVIKIVLDGEVIGVLSNVSFQGGVEASNLGFSNVYRGLTLKDYNINTRYSTTSTDVVFHGLHEQLDETYPRRNQDEHITGNWIVDNNYMFQFGSAGNSKITFENPGGGFPDRLVIEHGAGNIVLSSNGGTITFNGDAFAPNADGTVSLGATGQRYENVFAQTLNAGGALGAGNIVGIWALGASAQLNPDGDNGNDLGQAALRWKNVYTFNLNSGADQGTIKGNWQLEDSIEFVPETDGANDLGSSGRRFNTIFANGLSASDPYSSLQITGEVTADGSLIPAQDQVYNIGSTDKKYNTIYTSDFDATSASIGSLTATLNKLSDSFANNITRFDRDAQLTANSDGRLPTQKAVKAYVDAVKNALITSISDLQTSLQDQINDLKFVPSGAIFHLATSTCPSGYLICDGDSYSTTAYPALFAAIGYTYGGSGTTFKVPDLRGLFVRGVDLGRGIDSSRVFGSEQADAIGSHQHNVDDLYGLNDDQGPAVYDRNGNRIEYYSGWGSDGDNDSGNPAWYYNQTAFAGANETRPRNVALLPIIKY